MDMFHKLNGVECDPALTVLATVVSTPYPGKLVTDVGIKSMNFARGYPVIKGYEDAEFYMYHVEHSQIKMKDTSCFKIGDKLELIPFFVGPTVNLYDKYHVSRKGKIVAEWDVMARGMSQ
jgi:D-serine deaminase-like pyridoxal phosphate-dependent protein